MPKPKPAPRKPSDVTDGSIGPVTDDQEVSKHVLAMVMREDATLKAAITSNAPFFRVTNFQVHDLELVTTDEGPQGSPLTFWQETNSAESDGSLPLRVSATQRVHVTVALKVQKNRLPAGPVNGTLALQGGTSPIVVALGGIYTPAPAPPPPHDVTPPADGGGAAADCGQLLVDLTNAEHRLTQLESTLRNTAGPEGPNTPRDQLETAIASLKAEIATIGAVRVAHGCELNPVGGPSTQVLGSPVYGAVTLQGAILSKWLDLATQETAAGQSVQQFLGLPVRPTRFVAQTNRQLNIQEFEHGVIINVEGSGAPHVVHGAIYARYHQLGGSDGFLGVPLSDELDANRGRVVPFEGGQIVWDPIGGSTHEVHGAILQRWLQLKGAAGILGFPATDELPVIVGAVEVGRYQLFDGPGGSGAAIYFSPRTGASEIFGPIYSFWRNLHGGVTGNFGFPTSPQGVTPAGTAFHTFQKGIVVVPTGSDPVAITGGLKLQLFRFIVDDDFNVQVSISDTTGQLNQGRMPAGGQFDPGSQQFGPDTLLTAPAVDHGALGVFIPPGLVINIRMEAISERLIGEDAREGTITVAYNMDNAWGLTEASHSHKDGAFTAEFEIQPTDTPTITNSARFRQEAFWPFGNPTRELTWAQYEKTFRDVAETDKHINLNPLHLNLHIFEILFYETVYRSLANGGTCFGMSLESIYARAARSLFLEPIFSSNSYQKDGYVNSMALLDASLPNSAEVADEVSVKHGYQLGAVFINWFLGRWIAGALRDPVRAFRESREASARGDFPMLTVSNESEFSSSGHVVVPYLWMGGGSPILPGDQWQILCANPNNPAGPIPDTVDDHCRIVIHPFDNRFEFHFGDDKAGRPIFWTGSNVNGGRLLAVPFSQLSEQPVTLGDEIFALLGSSVLVILAGGAETSQLTDEKGRSLFTTREIPDGTGTRTIRVVHPELSARIPNLMPVVHREASPVSQRPEVYYWQRDAGPLQGHKAADTSAMELHHDIQAPAGTPYRYTVCSTTSMTSISADRGSPAGHRVSLHNLGAATQKIVIHSPNDAGASPTNFRVQTAGWQVDRGAPIWFEFGASIAPGQQLHFHVGNAGTQLTVQSANADAVLDLQMFTRATDPAAPPISATRSQIPIPAGQVLRFDPLSWTRDDLAAGKVNRAVLAAFGSATVLNKTTI